MRLVVFAFAALALSACGVVSVTTDQAGTQKVDLSGSEKSGGWRMSVVADEKAKVFLLRRPDGLMAAAKVEGQKSSLMEAGEAQAMVSEQDAAFLAGNMTGGDRVSIKVPGFSLDVQDGGDGSDRGNVFIKAGGRTIDVKGGDGGDGERAVVNIGGGTAEDAANFIEEADGLDEATQAALKQALGL